MWRLLASISMFQSLFHEYLIIKSPDRQSPISLISHEGVNLSIQGTRTLTARKRYFGADFPLDNRYQGKVLYMCSLLKLKLFPSTPVKHTDKWNDIGCSNLPYFTIHFRIVKSSAMSQLASARY